ncbi:hypothetical protein [Aphanothece stagnina]
MEATQQGRGRYGGSGEEQREKLQALLEPEVIVHAVTGLNS